MKVSIVSLGCKVNQYEADLIMKKFVDSGYEICDFKDKVDICIVNSCSVTNLSTRKSRQYLSRARKTGNIVVLTGCYAQEIDSQDKIQNVDIIIGNEEKNDIVEIVEKYIKQADKKLLYKVSEISKIQRYTQNDKLNKGREIRESVKIEDGCDNFCTYCIIPYVRGRVRSRNLVDIKSEIENLVKSGVGEIVLVGIEIASYGKDLDEDLNLIDVVKEVSKIDGLKRIRLGSLEPRILTKENIIELSKIGKLCPHFHLSVQSLDNNVLKRMNRKYTREDVFEVVANLKKYFNNPAITSDIIVGFPKETNEEFENTLKGAEKIGFYEIHVFKYSKRKWTVAAKMEGQVDGNISQKRSEILISLAQKLKMQYMENFLNSELSVLVENRKDGYYKGYTKNYMMVKIKTNEKNLIGKEIKVKSNTIEDECFIV